MSDDEQKTFDFGSQSKTSAEVKDPKTGQVLELVSLFLKAEVQGDDIWTPQKASVAQDVISAIQKIEEPSIEVLDVGCGIGTDLRRWACALQPPFTDRVTWNGVDVMPGLIEAVNTKNLGPSHSKFLIGDLHNLPFSENSFHLVHGSRLLIHSHNPNKGIDEMVRVMKPSGYGFAIEGDMAPIATPNSRIPVIQKIESLSWKMTHDSVANPRSAFTVFWRLKELENEPSPLVFNVQIKPVPILITDYQLFDPDLTRAKASSNTLLESGQITSAEREEYLQALTNSKVTGDPIQMCNLYTITWRKSPAGSPPENHHP